jgi:serine/threonine protein phosphatase PrpC
MGGYEGGEVASDIVVETVRRFFERNAEDSELTWPFGMDRNLGFVENMLAVALRIAHREVSSRKVGHLAKMGATVAALVLQEGMSIVGHLGDSRVYRLRRGKLEGLTKDHSLVAELQARGLEPPADTSFSHVVTRAIGMDEALDPELRAEKARPGDIFLLCSDGLTDVLDDGEILKWLRGREPREAAEALVRAAFEAGGSDNITAVVVQVSRLRRGSKP